MKSKRTKLLSSVICVVLSISMVVNMSYATKSSEIKDKMTKMQKQKEDAQSQVSTLKEQLTSLVAELNEVEEALVAKGNEVIKSQKILKRAKRKEKKQYNLMKKRIVFMYESGNKDLVGKLLEADSMADLLTRYEYIEQISNSDKKVFDDFVALRYQVQQETEKLEAEQAELEAKEKEYASKQSELDNLIASKQSEIGDLTAALASASEEYSKARAEEGNVPSKVVPSGGGNVAYNDSKVQTVTGNIVVDRAYSQVGKPYVWGACGPNAFDCSGFVSYALTGSYSRIGTSGTFGSFTRVSEPQPGDICCEPGHVGIYIGGGQMIHAPQSGDVVRVSPVHSGMWFTRY